MTKKQLTSIISLIDECFVLNDISNTTSLSKEWVTAVASYQVLEMFFGIKPQTMFSIITYNSDNINNFITVQRG